MKYEKSKSGFISSINYERAKAKQRHVAKRKHLIDVDAYYAAITSNNGWEKTIEGNYAYLWQKGLKFIIEATIDPYLEIDFINPKNI